LCRALGTQGQQLHQVSLWPQTDRDSALLIADVQDNDAGTATRVLARHGITVPQGYSNAEFGWD
jgi:hypothetical protein